MRTITSTLLTAQSASKRTPFIHMLFTSKDGLTTKDLSTNSAAYGNRVLLIDHREEAYNDYAVVVLRNHDKTIPSIKGYWTEIGYGDGAEYAGDGSNGGSLASPRLWVKSQQTVSSGGRLYTILELEGMWARLREELIRLGSAPIYNYEYAATTSYDIIEAIIETEMLWTLSALGTQDDSIIDTLAMNFDINSQQFEYAAGILYRLVRFTKTFLRPRAGLTFDIRYPQAADSVDLTFYSSQAPWFCKYTDRNIIHSPNRIYTFGNAGTDGAWASYVTGDESDSTSIDAYAEIADIYLAPEIATAGNADLISAALLSKVKAQSVAGIGLVPHHCAVELYDKIQFIDNRVSQSTYPADGTVRVGGLRHIYRPGVYQLEITMGGVSTTGEIARSAGGQVLVFTDTEEKAVEVKVETFNEPKQPAPSKHTAPSPVAPAPSVTLIPTMPGIWTPAEPTEQAGPPVPPPAPLTPIQAITEGVKAGFEQTVLAPLEIAKELLTPVWRAVTPWKEEAGETFGSEVRERVESATRWFRGLFGR